MQVTDEGYFVFDCDDEVLQANRLIRAIQKQGYANSNEELWVLWLQSEMGQRCEKDAFMLIVWTTVFLPRLMWSVLCHVQGVDL
jgi:hypothetical protein